MDRSAIFVFVVVLYTVKGGQVQTRDTGAPMSPMCIMDCVVGH
uniref:Uncharacterized protein n=1 Tax=Rhodnius prolixus TaxID=13249 RepID=T1HJ24_RHOPR